MLKALFRSLPKSVQNLIENGFVGIIRRLPLKSRIKIAYFKSFGKFPNLKNPQLYSERLQARKLSGEDFSQFVDKILAKDFVGYFFPNIVIPTYFHGTELPPVNERSWPLPYVIKTTHASGGNIFVRAAPDWNLIENKISKFLSHRHGDVSGEIFYDSIKPRVIVEKMIGSGSAPEDYRIFTVGGEVQFICVEQSPVDHRRVFYSKNWDKLNIRDSYPVGSSSPRPKNLDMMIEIAEKLGSDLGFVRVDLYEVDGHVYFGEMTMVPSAGYMKFWPPELDAELGSKWGAFEEARHRTY